MPLNDKQQAQFDTVCLRIAEGESLRAACKRQSLPAAETIRAWLAAGDSALSAQYARARDEQADHYADEIITIADDASLSSDDRRIRLDARKWVASKLKPRKYGDKLALGGADDLPAIRQEVQERADSFTRDIATMAGRTKAEVKH